jgi:fucose permease
MYVLLIAVIYLAFISLGLPDSLLGSAWPTLHVAFGVPISYMGIISIIISAGTVISSLLSERLTARFGTRAVTTVSVLFTSVALFGFSLSGKFYQLCLFAIPYGIGAGAIDASLNNYVALHYSSKHMSWLHCFWGVGTIISPYVMSYALIHSGWQAGYRAVSLIQLCIFIVLLIALPLWKINSKGKKDEIKEITKPLGIVGALKIPGVPYLLIGFLAYCAAESTTMLWASSYLEEAMNLSKDEAAALGSLFFIGMTVGRFFAGFITEKLGDGKMIRLGTVIALIGVGLITIRINLPAIVGFILIGLGCAPIYPSIIHSTPSNFGEKNSAAIIGIQMASAYTGSLLAPPLFGIIADGISLKILPIFLLGFFILMIVMIRKTERTVK